LTPYRLGVDEWTKESPVGRRPFEGQMDVIWIRTETSLSPGNRAKLTRLTDKAALLQLAEIWKHLQDKAAAQSREPE
jgi:hypothetical protein